MKKRLIIITLLTLVAILVYSTAAFAGDGPKNAGGNSSKWEFGEGVYIFPASLYIGPDYGAGTKETECSDGTWVDVINNATLLAKGHYFSDEDFTEKDWVDYKFWLTEPVDMLIGGVTPYTATEFIFFKWMIGSTGDIILVAYK